MLIMKLLLFVLLIPWTVGACSVNGGCTEIGCFDAAYLSVRTKNDQWPDGDYELTLTVGDEKTTCEFKLPEAFEESGSTEAVVCDRSLGYMGPTLRQVTECEEMRSGDSVSNSCTPVADEYTLEIAVSGTPGEVELRLTRDGEELVDRSLALSYQNVRPNGPGCGPVCRQTAKDIEVP